MTYGKAPKCIMSKPDINLPEMMHYLYLPVMMPEDRGRIAVPDNLGCLGETLSFLLGTFTRYKYAYVSARRGIASPGNSLNRPGWHCDGFGTDDLNFIWWKGAGTRFAIQDFTDISDDEQESMVQLEAQVRPECVVTPPVGGLYLLDRYVVHAAPVIECAEPRQFVKISLSNEQYNLDGNSHNYLFNYDWPLLERKAERNVTSK